MRAFEAYYCYLAGGSESNIATEMKSSSMPMLVMICCGYARFVNAFLSLTRSTLMMLCVCINFVPKATHYSIHVAVTIPSFHGKAFTKIPSTGSTVRRLWDLWWH